MEVNSGISNLMREWLTKGMDRSGDKPNSFAPPIQPRPERLGLGATPHPASLAKSCGTVNTVRRNISKRIKSTSKHIGCTTHQYHDIDKGLNEDEGSRSFSFCKKLTTSDAPLKIQEKRKQRKKNKCNIIQDKKSSSPIHSIATLEENIPCVVDRTHKPKKWNLRLRYGLFRPQTNCTRLRWRKCFVKRIPQ